MFSFQKMETLGGVCKSTLILGLVLYLTFIYFSNQYPSCPSSSFFLPFIKSPPQPSISNSEKFDQPSSNSSTNLSHLVFGLVGSEEAWHHRKPYIESWWRPNVTRGVLFLDKPPSSKLLPWSPSSPPYKVSDDLTALLNKKEFTAQRIIHGIMEAFREDHENLRWLVMGDDDSVFFLDNMIEALAQYDHRKYYYIGGQSEFIMSNFWYSFSQGFGGAGFILSYPLAKALAKDMEKCLLRYRHLNAADQTTMSCVADLGVSLTPHKGIHQIDLRGDISGFLSSHPKSPLLSLHHFDAVNPIFPTMDRPQSTRHLMKAATVDQSRMLQQTICYHRQKNWSLSVSWGYSAHIYENIMPRSYLQMPIETFDKWQPTPGPPDYMFNTRRSSDDPCEAPHVFYYTSVEKIRGNYEVLTTFSRARPRGLAACSSGGNHSADSITRIQVYSPATKRVEIDRSECCDIVRVHGDKAEVQFRECMPDETVA